MPILQTMGGLFLQLRAELEKVKKRLKKLLMRTALRV